MGKSDELRVQIRNDEAYIWGLFTKESCRIRRNNAYCCDGCVLYTRRENTTWIIEQAGMMQVVQRYYRRIKNARRAKFCKLNEKSVMLVQFDTRLTRYINFHPAFSVERKSSKREWTPITKKSKGILLFFNLIKRTIPQNYLILVTRRFLHGRKNEKKENKNSLSWWYFLLRRGEKKKEKYLSRIVPWNCVLWEGERKYLTNKHEDDARFNPVINMEWQMYTRWHGLKR